MSYPIVSFKYVSKTFGDPLDYQQLVLRNINFDIMPGEFIIIFGPSGSGKSTLLNLMAGLEFASAGKVMVRHRDLAHFESDQLAYYHRQKIGMVFQSFNLIKSLNVWENVALPQTANQVRYETRQRRAKHLLKLLGIEEVMHRYPNEISGGQQQRVAIARALNNNPYLMLVDEPTGNLDTKAAEDVMNLIHGLHDKARHTIVLVTHNPEYIHYATRVLYVQDGTIIREEVPANRPTEIVTDIPVQRFDQLGAFKDPNV